MHPHSTSNSISPRGFCCAQGAYKRLGVQPLAVHATYSLDNHDGLAKAQRFREAGLWRVDPPEYFRGKFLVLNASVSPALQVSALSQQCVCVCVLVLLIAIFHGCHFRVSIVLACQRRLL